MDSIGRRDVLVGAASIGVAGLSQVIFGPLSARADAALAKSVYREFPSHDPAVVKETVGASHARFDRVRELVTAQPALARAAWDWGFGDWESALGAASHMGRRDIAEFLIEHGARPTLFSAAMLGQLEVVRGFVQASPGIQRTPGPHGITLLSHARHGGDEAKRVVEYLESVGDADLRPETVQLEGSDRAKLVGTYGFGDGPEDRFTVYERDESLMIQRGKRTGRFLMALGDDTFYPSGAEAVRIRFDVEGAGISRLRVLDPDVVVTALRL